MSMTAIFIVCRDEPRHSVCTCAGSRCCGTAQTREEDRAQYSSVFLLPDVAIDDTSGNTIQTHPVRPQGVASPLPLRCCPPAAAGANAACAWAAERSRPL